MGAGAEGGVAEGADGGEDEGDDEHDGVEEAGEVVRVGHGGLDGEKETDAFEAEDGGADGQGEIAGVEELDGWIGAVRGERGEVVVPDVDEAEEDEDVGEEGRGAEFGYVADEGEGDEDDELDCYEGRSAQWSRGGRSDGVEERGQVLGHEDDAGADETDLGDGDGSEDQSAEPGASDHGGQVAVAAPVALSA